MSLLEGEWAEPKKQERYIEVVLKVSESLARDASPEALSRLLGDDAMRRVRELLAEDNLEKIDNRLEEIETVERRAAGQLDAERWHREQQDNG
jgi:hypothetical protein